MKIAATGDQQKQVVPRGTENLEFEVTRAGSIMLAVKIDEHVRPNQVVVTMKRDGDGKVIKLKPSRKHRGGGLIYKHGSVPPGRWVVSFSP